MISKFILSIFLIMTVTGFLKGGCVPEMPRHSKIYVAGHTGLVGSAIVRELHRQGYANILTRNSSELDLTDQSQVASFFHKEKPEYVFLAAAKVGGIKANNDYPADFIYKNLAIELNVIHSSYLAGVKKLLFLGSSCIYPRICPQPIQESSLLTGALEPTNEAYAVAKIAGIKMCEAYNRQYGTKFISCMPTNLYGPNDNFDLTSSHVLPALIRKFSEAKKRHLEVVEVWGTGKPKREFLHVDDLANATVFLMNYYEDNEIVNVGCGQDITIESLASMIKDSVGFQGNIRFNADYPDGIPQKLLDVSKMQEMGWEASISLADGIKLTVDWYENNVLERIDEHQSQ